MISELSPITKMNLISNYPSLYQYINKNKVKTLTFKKGDYISQPDNYFMYIYNGSIKTLMHAQDGTERLLYLVLSDSILIGSQGDSFQSSFYAYMPCTIWYFSIDDFFSFLQSDKSSLYDFYTIVLDRCNILMQYVLGDSKYSSKQKVFRLIYHYALAQGTIDPSSGNTIIEKIPINVIASLTNVYRSNVSLYLNMLVSENILYISNNSLIIKDLSALEKKIYELDS